MTAPTAFISPPGQLRVSLGQQPGGLSHARRRRKAFKGREGRGRCVVRQTREESVDLRGVRIDGVDARGPCCQPACARGLDKRKAQRTRLSADHADLGPLWTHYLCKCDICWRRAARFGSCARARAAAIGSRRLSASWQSTLHRATPQAAQLSRHFMWIAS